MKTNGINTGWHKQYEDGDYFAYCPGLVPSAAEWMIEKGVKVVGHDTQANDNPLATAIAKPEHQSPLRGSSLSVSNIGVFQFIVQCSRCDSGNRNGKHSGCA